MNAPKPVAQSAGETRLPVHGHYYPGFPITILHRRKPLVETSPGYYLMLLRQRHNSRLRTQGRQAQCHALASPMESAVTCP